MSECIAITQCTIMLSANFVGRFSSSHGRRTLLLIGFSVLPIRALLYTLLHAVPALFAVQLTDEVANAIFGVVSILVIADRTRERVASIWEKVPWQRRLVSVRLSVRLWAVT